LRRGELKLDGCSIADTANLMEQSQFKCQINSINDKA